MKLNRLFFLLLVLPGMLVAPAQAKTVQNLQKTGKWSHSHDRGTPGSSSGWTALTKSPSRTGFARHLATTYQKFGGERYETHMPDDVYAHNFVYDAWVYIKGPSKNVKIIEMDLNHVVANGWTVIMGFQCDGWSGTWDYTANLGTAKRPKDRWLHSSAKCSPQKWKANAWHHVQIHYFHDNAGHVIYQSVVLDGKTEKLQKKVFSGFALGWGRTILTNFQVDGGTRSKGSSHVYVDQMNVSYW